MIDDLDEDIYLAEVEDRLEDLKFEYGDDPSSEIKIFQKLRDEFKDTKYQKALQTLNISNSELGIKSSPIKNSNSNLWGSRDNKHLETIVQILLNPQVHIRNTQMRLNGNYESNPGEWRRIKGYMELPSEELMAIIQFLEDIFLPQNIISKKHLTITDFEDSMNRQLHHIRVRLENHPDHIVPPGQIKFIIHILLNNVQVIKNAIESGRLGDLATDMITGSVTERNDPKPNLTRDQIIDAFQKGSS